MSQECLVSCRSAPAWQGHPRTQSDSLPIRPHGGTVFPRTPMVWWFPRLQSRSYANIEKIDLLKLDIEGTEERVLANGTFLARTEHIIVELHGHYGIQC